MFWNVTQPSVTAAAGLPKVTFAVNVTESPYVEVFDGEEEVTAVVVSVGFTFCDKVLLLELKVASPL